MNKSDPSTPVVIKKYSNRRLYNTSTNSYVTLNALAEMIRQGVDFVVNDVKTGEDLTCNILTQIVFEEESKGNNLLPINFLRHLISLYGNNIQGLVPSYLEYSLTAFIRNHERIQTYMQNYLQSFTGMVPFQPLNSLEEINKRNIDFFENTMRLFNPFQALEDPRAQQALAIQELLEKLYRRIDDLETQIQHIKRSADPSDDDSPT